jgi:translation initiation factor IF-1
VELYIMENKTIKGVVIEVLPAALYRVLFEDKRELICYLGGKMKFNHISVLAGDIVDVVLDPYKGKATNRIVKRH